MKQETKKRVSSLLHSDLNDFSKTIRSKQLSVIGKLSNEDITPFLRKIEKSQGLSFAEMKPQTWFYDGKIFLSPTFSQGNGKPFIINETLKQKWLSSPAKKENSLRENKRLVKQTAKQKHNFRETKDAFLKA